MDQINHDILMNALREVNPELANTIDFLFQKDRSIDDDRVRTFEDCARVEQDIMSKLYSTNPFQ